MACTCIKTVNEDLRTKHNTELVWLMDFRGEGPTRCVVETQTHVKKRGAKPITVAANYCPFCGVKYEGDAA